MRYLEQLCEAFRASMPGDTVLVTGSRAADTAAQPPVQSNDGVKEIKNGGWQEKSVQQYV